MRVLAVQERSVKEAVAIANMARVVREPLASYKNDVLQVKSVVVSGIGWWYVIRDG